MNNSLLLGQYYPEQSLLHRLDPRIKIICLLSYFVAFFFAKDKLTCILVSLFAILAILFSRIPLRSFLHTFRYIFLLLFLTILLNAFLTDGEGILWQYQFFTLSKEGIIKGLLMAGRLLLMVSMAFLLSFTTTPLALADGLERLLRPGQKIGLPTQELSMMVGIAMRFIPTLGEEMERIYHAQAARGLDLHSGSFIKRIRHSMPLLIPFFFNALQRADDLAFAMEARGYQPGIRRTRMKQLHCSAADVMVLLLSLALCVFVLVWRFI